MLHAIRATGGRDTQLLGGSGMGGRRAGTGPNGGVCDGWARWDCALRLGVTPRFVWKS